MAVIGFNKYMYPWFMCHELLIKSKFESYLLVTVIQICADEAFKKYQKHVDDQNKPQIVDRDRLD